MKTLWLCHEEDTVSPQIHPQAWVLARGQEHRARPARPGNFLAPDPQAPGKTTYWPLTAEASRLRVPHLTFQGNRRALVT